MLCATCLKRDTLGHTVNFLDATLRTDGSYKRYGRPSGAAKCVSRASNRPPSALGSIPESIQWRLGTISSSEDEFGGARDEYQKALEEAGYADTLAYDPNINRANKPKGGRGRRIIWYNPPCSKNVATNIGGEFFELLCLHFPKQHPLHRLFNDNTVKLSYSCMPNMDSIVRAHNTEVLRKGEEDMGEEGCGCGDRSSCPVEGRCLKAGVVYRAAVRYGSGTSHCIGMPESSFETRCTQHRSSLKHSRDRSQTELSNLVWSLKDNTPYQLTWHIIDNAQPYQPGKRSCTLCLAEKYHILTGKHLVNKKTELLNKCPHRRKFLTCNLKP